MKFESTYKTLPPLLFQETNAEQFATPTLIAFNAELSRQLGLNLENKSAEELAQIFVGQPWEDYIQPISLAYAGHQFGYFVPQLGDGRALLLGEIVDPQGKRFDVQLKGSCRTHYSRKGDGRSPLGPVLREYLVSDAMAHLGVPTTRSLAAVATGETVYRETNSPGAVLTRMASSHIRIGTFQFLAAREDKQALEALLKYAVARHYPELFGAENVALAFLTRVADKQIELVAQWMSLGFIHGVMNTDNMTISGETIDYGPCAFMDHFNFGQVYSYIDTQGRYAYGNQGKILFWNLARLADCLIPLLGVSETAAVNILNHLLSQLPQQFSRTLNRRMAMKFGLFSPEDEQYVQEILKNWFQYLESEKLDFTLSFRKLSNLLQNGSDPFFPATEQFKNFETLWRGRVQQNSSTIETIEKMNQTNPLFIPRNHQVEKAIALANEGDFSLFHTLNRVLSKPFQEQPGFQEFTLPPKPEEKIQNTFCGT